MTLIVSHAFECVVTDSMILPAHKQVHPAAGLILARKGPAGVIGPVFTARDRDSQSGLSFVSTVLEKDLSTPTSSSRDSSVAPRMALPLSAWRIRGCSWHWSGPKPLGRRKCSLRHACCTRSKAMSAAPPRPHQRPSLCGSRHRPPDRGTATRPAQWSAGS